MDSFTLYRMHRFDGDSMEGYKIPLQEDGTLRFFYLNIL